MPQVVSDPYRPPYAAVPGSTSGGHQSEVHSTDARLSTAAAASVLTARPQCGIDNNSQPEEPEITPSPRSRPDEWTTPFTTATGIARCHRRSKSRRRPTKAGALEMDIRFKEIFLMVTFTACIVTLSML